MAIQWRVESEGSVVVSQNRVEPLSCHIEDDGRERIEGSLPTLTLSPGYYKRAEYLLWLEKCKNTGLADGDFTLAESEGLMAVAEARAQFERNHPPCGVCSALQDSPFSTSCHKCGTEFMRRSN